MKENNVFITEISENDFRKLNLYGYKHVQEQNNDGSRSLIWKKFSLNEELDAILDSDLVSDAEKYEIPITFAIHNENGPQPKDFYLDKFMNMYSGPTTVQEGIGIKHLYSTRDYFEDHDDYWRVAKKETKVLYRVHINKNE